MKDSIENIIIDYYKRNNIDITKKFHNQVDHMNNLYKEMTKDIDDIKNVNKINYFIEDYGTPKLVDSEIRTEEDWNMWYSIINIQTIVEQIRYDEYMTKHPKKAKRISQSEKMDLKVSPPLSAYEPVYYNLPIDPKKLSNRSYGLLFE